MHDHLMAIAIERLVNGDCLSSSRLANNGGYLGGRTGLQRR
jgi:hypothetical protein